MAADAEKRTWIETFVRAWELEADEVVVLPIDELALAVLRDVIENGDWSSYNWMQLARKRAYADRPDALRAFAEAWIGFECTG